MIKRYSLPLGGGMAFFAIAAASWAVYSPVDDWKIAGPFGGTATALAVDPQNTKTVLAGAMQSLVYRSDDAAMTWNLVSLPKRNLSEVTSILIDPADSKHYLVGIIAAEGGGLFESHDEGATWKTVKDLQDLGVRALAASASDPSRFVAGTLEGVMLSNDSGKRWKRISDPDNLEMRGITAVAIDTKDPDIIYAGTTHLPWKTMDGGKTWESIHTGMIDDSDVFSIYVNPSTPSDVLASACSGVYSSTDRGNLWRKLLGIPNTSRRTHVVREDPLNPSTIYAGTTAGLFKSPDHGMSWRSLTSGQVNAMAFDPLQPGAMYLAFEYEGIGKSNSAGDQIYLADNGFVDRVISWVTVSGHKLYAVETQEGETSGLFVSYNRGESWLQLHNMHGLDGVHLRTIAGSPTDEKLLLAASPRQMYRSVDAGATWKAEPVRLLVSAPVNQTPKVSPRKTRARSRYARTVKPRIVTRDISPSEINGLYTVKSGTNEILFAATDLGLLESGNFGEYWKFADVPGSLAVTAMYSAPNSDGYLVIRTPGGLYFSKDFGDHWAVLPFPLPPSDINDVAIPADSNSPLLVATRVGLYLSNDGGNKWYPNPGGMPVSTFSTVIYTGFEKHAYAVEYGRLYETKNAGESWARIPSALNSLWIRQLWMARDGSERLYGITGDLGILFRN